MSYKALYRKWRPQVFEEVVGQEHITMTLKNQIKNNNIAHAYLFCGTRGTGKTSTAKIFARAINCLNPIDFNPCNECEVCKGILDESLMDVVEIDAASNNGVDNIRELRENVKYPPSKTRYKVYIIDEVHMLSQGAFNALLKTLEEPPEYVKFILATTEPHKILGTILSRCQRFDFKRIDFNSILNRLKYICENMGVEAEEDALKLIVRNSDGAVRDALSILDQCLSFSEGKLTHEKAVETLGLVTDEFLFKLTDAIYEEDSKGAMGLVDDLVNSGKDIGQFVKDLINHFRNLMMTKMTESLEEVIDMSRENIERLKKQGQNFNVNTLIRSINILSEAEAEVRWSSQPRILLELSVIKLIQPAYDNSYEGLLDRIDKLEKKLENFKMDNVRPLAITSYDNQREESKKETNIETNVIKRKPKDISKDIKPEKLIAREENIPTVDNKPANYNIEEIKKKWNNILNDIKKKKVQAYALLIEGKVATIEENRLIISFREGYWFHKDAASKPANSEIIEKAIYDFTGQKLKIKCVMEDELKDISEPEEIIVEEDNTEEEVKQVKEFFSDFQDKLEIIDE